MNSRTVFISNDFSLKETVESLERQGAQEITRVLAGDGFTVIEYNVGGVPWRT